MSLARLARRFVGSPLQFLAKLIVTASAFVAVVKLFKVDWSAVFASSVRASDFAWMSLFVLALMVPNALRWHVILARLRVNLPLRRVVLITFGGMFFNQVLPGGVGGDVYRVAAVRPFHVSLWRAFHSVFADRALSIAATALLIVVSLFLFPVSTADWSALGLLLAALAAAIGLVGILYGGQILARPLCRIGRHLKGRRFRFFVFKVARGIREAARAAQVAVKPPLASAQSPVPYAIVTQLAVVFLAYWIARNLAILVSFSNVAATVPAVILLSMLPISFGGWGVREIAAVVLLGAVGVPADKALGLSIVFGLVNLAAGIAAGALILLCGAVSSGRARAAGHRSALPARWNERAAPPDTANLPHSAE